MPQRLDRVLLVVNLGTPEAPTADAVRRYLAEFLGDRRVVDLPPVVWKPLLHGMILPLRGPKSAALYAKVWTDEGSPLLTHTVSLAAAIAERLPDWSVIPAMTYGQPSLAAALTELRACEPRQVVVLPLYPQYSTTTTASVQDQVDAFGEGLPTVTISDYSGDPAWQAAVAARIVAARSGDTSPRHLLFSFHGLPQKVVDKGDPYPTLCHDSAREIARLAGLPDDLWTVAFQSKFGPAPWLGPATTDTVERLADAGIDQLDVACPGFAVDCLETLEEIQIRLAEQFEARGGRLRYIPCLNDSPAHADALAGLAERTAGVDQPDAV